MRVRCSFCGAAYEAAVTRAALLLVARCERCGRARLESVDDDSPGREQGSARAERGKPGGPPEAAA